MKYKALILLPILAIMAFSSACRSKDSSNDVSDQTLNGQWKLGEKASNGWTWTQFLYLSTERNFVQLFLAKDEQTPGDLMAEAEIDLLPAGEDPKELLVKAKKVIFDQYTQTLPIIGNEAVRWAIVEADADRMLLQAENKHPGLVFASEFGKSCASANRCGGEVEFKAAKQGDVEANLKPDGFDQDAKVPVSSEHFYCDESTITSPEKLAAAKSGQWLTYDVNGAPFKCRVVTADFIPAND